MWPDAVGKWAVRLVPFESRRSPHSGPSTSKYESHRVRITLGVEPRRHQAHGKVSGCQHSARDTMVFIAGAAITHQYGNAVQR